MGQLSFWSADARPRGLGDLEGLLCGPGQAELFGRGSAARLVIVLGPPPNPEPDDEGEPDEDACGDDEPDEESDEEPGDAEPGDAEPGDVEPGDEGPEEDSDDEAPAEPDPDDLAFLDLDPDELAARLAPRAPRRPRPTLAPPSREGGPGVERQRGRHAGTTPAADPETTWRAGAVCCALRARGVPAEVGRSGDGRPEVRTAFRTDLADLARAWTTGAGAKAVPAGFELDGPRLRLWVLAAGGHDGRAYTLGLDPVARELDDALLTASRRAGLGATLAGDGRPPGLRIVGARRQGRLGELVGLPPRDLAAGIWPV